MVFPEHALAHRLLDGLRGLEIGAAAHNPFGLQTRNVAPLDDYAFYAIEQAKCGASPSTVEIWGDADNIPVEDDTEDFVLSSHVVEHLPNVIATFIEWNRIVRVGGYVFLIAPLPDALPADRDRDLTTLEHLIEDYQTGQTVDTHPVEGVPGGRRGHYHVFRPDTIVQLVEWMVQEGLCDWELAAREDVDTKVGNGFTLAYRVKSKAMTAFVRPPRAESRQESAIRKLSYETLFPSTPAAEPAFRVAMIGTFEVANYGDLLFPAIFERLGRRRIPGLTLRLFSPSDGIYAFDQSSVRSVRSLAAHAAELEAVAFGGGDIARFDPASWMPGTESRSGYADLVVLPAVVAAAAGVPFAWNAPGVSPGVTRIQSRLLAKVAATTCYSAVRDAASAHTLTQAGHEVRIVPDTGFLLAEAFPKQELAAIFERLSSEFDLPPQYITVHLSLATASISDFTDAGDMLARLSEERSIPILLLPLGPMHGETKALSKLAARHPGRLTCLPSNLHPLEWAAILAHSSTHIGSGLHGNISAFAYGVPVVVVNSRGLAKLDQFVATTGSPMLSSWSEIESAVQAAHDSADDDRRRQVVRQAHQHLSDLLDAIRAPSRATDAIGHLSGLAGDLLELTALPTAASRETGETLRSIARVTAEAEELRSSLKVLAAVDDELHRLRASILLQNETLGQRALNSARAMRDALFPEHTSARRLYCGIRKPVDRASRLPAAITRAVRNGLRNLRTNRIRRRYQRLASRLQTRPLVSLLTPVYNVDEQWLIRAVESVQNQAYSNWELCLVNDASPAPHIRPLLDRLAASDSRIRVAHREQNGGIVAASNDALAMARGELIGLLDHDDELAVNALYEIVARVNLQPDLDLIYSDEDKITADGVRFDAVLKPGWNPGLLHSCNYITHFSVFRTELVRSIGGFRERLDGSQDYDLILRASEKARRIGHVPKVLYHWRVIETSTASSAAAKPYAYAAAVRALQDARTRRDSPGSVEILSPGLYRVRTQQPEWPRITIVFAAEGDRAAALKAAGRLLDETDYPALELSILAEIDSPFETRIGEVVARFQPAGASPVQDLNDAVRSTDTSLAVVLTTPLRPLREDWLKVLAEQMARADIGLVGARVYGKDGHLLHSGCTVDSDGLPVSTADVLVGHSILRTLYSELDRDCMTVGGGCVLVRRSAFDAAGGYDSHFGPALASETLGLRMRRAGWAVLYTPHAALQKTERGVKPVPASEAGRFRKLVRDEWPEGDPFFTPVRSDASIRSSSHRKAA